MCAIGCCDITPMGGIPLICPSSAGCVPNGFVVVTGRQVPYVVNPADATDPLCPAGQVRAQAIYLNGIAHSAVTDDFPVNSDVPRCNPVVTTTPTPTPTTPTTTPTPTPTGTPTRISTVTPTVNSTVKPTPTPSNECAPVPTLTLLAFAGKSCQTIVSLQYRDLVRKTRTRFAAELKAALRELRNWNDEQRRGCGPEIFPSPTPTPAVTPCSPVPTITPILMSSKKSCRGLVFWQYGDMVKKTRVRFAAERKAALQVLQDWRDAQLTVCR